MAFIPPPSEASAPAARTWRSKPQAPHYAVLIVLAALMAIAALWSIARLRSGADLGRVAFVLGVLASCALAAFTIARGYRTIIEPQQLSVRSTVGGLPFLVVPLDGLTHAYRTEMKTGAWSPNFSDGNSRASMPVNRGAAVVLLCDDQRAVRIAMSDPAAVLAELAQRGIPTILPSERGQSVPTTE